MNTPSGPTPQQLALLTRIIRQLTRARRMSREDAEDFGQAVFLKFVEREFDVFERFSGRSSLAAYLRVVLKRQLLDWQNQHYGKWRPSARATRLGPHAIALDRLINRDRHHPDEAVAMLATRPGAPPADELRELSARLGRRAAPRPVPVELLDEFRWVDFEDPVLEHERERTHAEANAALAKAVRRLPAEDRQLITLRYSERRTVQSVADERNENPKALYRRFDRVLRLLRCDLAAEGITGTAVHAVRSPHVLRRARRHHEPSAIA